MFELTNAIKLNILKCEKVKMSVIILNNLLINIKKVLRNVNRCRRFKSSDLREVRYST